MHTPVMTAGILEYLALRPDGVYIDATTGLGGHTAAIASLLTTGLVFASDRDAESIELARAATSESAAKIRFSHGPFSTLARRHAEAALPSAAGLIADLGVSRYQLTDAGRGFSLQADGPLDMRMDRSDGTTAEELLNHMPEKALADLIYQLGEERRSRQIARAIVRARPLRSTLHLAKVVEQAVPRTGKLHPATLTFMALRLAVNREMEELQTLLDSIPVLVAGGGRVVILTFMSIEDRIVKQAFQRLAREGGARLLTKHVVRPTDAEVARNPSSRSAKLRALEVKGE